MAFQKKERVATKDARPQMSKLAQREQLVATLKAENNPDARKLLKKMNDKVYRGSRSNLSEWFAPKGKKQTAR
ncbi:hypothetical protein D3C71_2034580 [compost metagenome]